MNIIRNERPIQVDVDETLVIHENPLSYSRFVQVSDPHEVGKTITLGVNEPIIKVLKDEKKRGSFITVWSRSGYAWAAAVVTALELGEYVDIVMTKPISYIDDKPVEQWLTDRVYLHPDTVYKKHD